MRHNPDTARGAQAQVKRLFYCNSLFFHAKNVASNYTEKCDSASVNTTPYAKFCLETIRGGEGRRQSGKQLKHIDQRLKCARVRVASAYAAFVSESL